MAKVPYNKPALTFADQLQQLKNRGLHVANDARAIHLLEIINYYRLSRYWYPMLDMPKAAPQFKANSTFENAFHLYVLMEVSTIGYIQLGENRDSFLANTSVLCSDPSKIGD